jgi:Xaa-Pro aminopeptidase
VEKKLLQPGFKIGFEAEHLSYSFFLQLKTYFTDTEFVPTEKLLENQAMRKDEGEIEWLRQAARIADEALGEVLPLVKPGIRERELAAELSYRMRLKGAERDAFDPIVASGRRSALPHATASEKKLTEGEFVVIDFGAVYKGYTSDMTRTVVVNKATAEMKKLYEAVRQAQAKAIEAARAGITAHALDQVARDNLTQAGYGQYFIHSLGHGLGLHVHSEPRVGVGSDVVLEENFVITIEPGIYIPDVGGVRIEDDVLIRKEGVECLTHFSRELMEIG